MLLSGHWIFGAAQAAMMAYHVKQYMAGRSLADVTEIFRQVGAGPRGARGSCWE